jgi:hypothetical protein
MPRWRISGRIQRPFSIQTAVGVALVALAVAVTFVANTQSGPATVDVLVAQHDLPSGIAVQQQRDLFRAVTFPADSPLRAHFVTGDELAQAGDVVLVRALQQGEPLLHSMLAATGPTGTVLTVSLPRVAALDGTVMVGETIRILTTDSTEQTGFVVEVVAVRTVGGSLGRQEQIALTVRVATLGEAARLAAAAQQQDLVLVRAGA